LTANKVIYIFLRNKDTLNIKFTNFIEYIDFYFYWHILRKTTKPTRGQYEKR